MYMKISKFIIGMTLNMNIITLCFKIKPVHWSVLNTFWEVPGKMSHGVTGREQSSKPTCTRQSHYVY